MEVKSKFMKYLILISILISGPVLYGQNITPTGSVSVGSTVVYTCGGGTAPSMWATQHGTVVSPYNGSSYKAQVTWHTVGTASLTALNAGQALGNLSVTVSVGPPSTSFTTTPACGSTTITRNQSPPSGVTWYWQTASGGTNTSNSSSSYTTTTTGTFYLRAYGGGSWSGAVATPQITKISTLRPPAPQPGPTGYAISDVISGVQVYVDPVDGATSYKWYTSTNTLISGLNGVSHTFSIPSNSSQTFYIEAMLYDCPSLTRASVVASVVPLPIINVTDGGEVILGANVTLSCANPIFDTYRWLDGNDAPITNATNPSLATNIERLYKLRVTKGTGNSSTSYTTPGIPVFSLNYIKTNDVLVDNISTTAAVDALAIGSRSQAVTFFDGLGRPIQSVVKQGAPGLKDIIQPIVYDEMGREALKYLPYVEGTGGSYRYNALRDINNTSANSTTRYKSGDQYKFYQTAQNIETSEYPYSETSFEFSPFSRPTRQSAPGEDWRSDGLSLETSTDHTTKYFYNLNDANEVLIWTYTPPSQNAPESVTFRKPGTGEYNYFPQYKLKKNRTRDEQGNVVIEYLDDQNRVILKRVQAVANAAVVNDSNYASTYYIYDDFGSLVVVLPPEAVKVLTSSN
jgi:hypothetical protein